MPESHRKESSKHNSIDNTVQGEALVIIKLCHFYFVDYTGAVNGLHQAMINPKNKERDGDSSRMITLFKERLIENPVDMLSLYSIKFVLGYLAG